MKKDEYDRDRNDIIGEGPENLLQRMPAFFGLPVKMESPRESEKWWVTLSVMAAVFLVFLWTLRSPAVVSEYGFYPSDPFKNFGLNIFVSNFLHGGWFHLIFNLYFFLILSNDIEELLGLFPYLVLLGATALATSSFTFLVSDSDLPHVGLSGIVMGFMAVYALAYPRVRFAYLVPLGHVVSFGKGSVSWMRGLGWIRLPIWVIAAVYLLIDILSYLFLESRGLSATSHSGHIGGAIGGLVFYSFFWLSRREASPLPVPVRPAPRKQLRAPD